MHTETLERQKHENTVIESFQGFVSDTSALVVATPLTALILNCSVIKRAWKEGQCVPMTVKIPWSKDFILLCTLEAIFDGRIIQNAVRDI